MVPNNYQLIVIGIIAILWLVVGNLTMHDSIRKKKLSWIHMLNPFVVFKFDRRDWGKTLLLIISIIGLIFLIVLLRPK